MQRVSDLLRLGSDVGRRRRRLLGVQMLQHGLELAAYELKTFIMMLSIDERTRADAQVATVATRTRTSIMATLARRLS